MTEKEANRLRLCMCCGKPDANLLRLSDGRNVRSCDDCARGCSFCKEWWLRYQLREPIGSEVDWMPGVSDNLIEDSTVRLSKE